MSANRKQASLVSWMIVVMVGVIGIVLFAFMWLRPQLGGATEGWKPINNQVSQLLETESSTSSDREPNKREVNLPTSDPNKAAQVNENRNSSSKGVGGDRQQGDKRNEQTDTNNQAQVTNSHTTKQPHNQHEASEGLTKENKKIAAAASNTNNVPTNATEIAAEQQSQLISLNRANEQQLDELPGVGPSKAKAIVAYREQHGKFNSIEEVMKVKGIGPKMFKKMKDKLTVD
ncbi:ComEA family DNA-binding protein [Paenibacillus arenosi]|uniref:Helix-hairpin-helix domain-containing protein n=1 Tax=Paenibacillus arenosi TaxID=2774142 RepID=A0ABR9AY32_9BACL|nr:helix-hairpin-helix domain-containing protein [Paenibacillus arenosi]MBD8499052.1 helix-hairpin-helix domain-containing protein [Paenibacillus arenosi]